MKTKMAALFAAAALIPLLSACGSADITENTLELKKDGSIVEYTVEDFSASYYDADELESFVDTEVEAYLAENDGSIRVSRNEVEDQTAYLTIKYDSAETYADFNGIECFVGSIVQAQAAGYDFDLDFIDASAEEDSDGSDEDADAEEDSGGSDEDADAAEDADLSADSETSDAEISEDSSAEDTSGSEASEDSSSDATVISGEIPGNSVVDDDDLQVLILQSAVNIIVPGKIQYVYGENVEIQDTNTVIVQSTENGGSGGLIYVLYK
ncbi:MAG: hypothetical protein LUF32_05190 [Clostridiales bacterium]|nr:hypothetical protein [Clostridiales bacterium]